MLNTDFCRRIPPFYLLNPPLFSLFSQSLAHRSRAGAAAVHESIKDALTGKTSDLKSTNTSFYQKTEARQSRSPSAIVIGGGFAGIAAAHALKNVAFQVVLLESRDRIGGRVHTNYSFGFPVDMGAAWLHGVCNENPLASWIGRLGLPIYRTSGDNSVLYDHDLESYALFDGDGHQVPQDLVEKVGKVEFEGLGELRSKDEEDEGLGELRSKDEEDEGI
ncbi:hypothetical protein ZIOFF_069454 [Zingiber officinale]|uniref:Amine oxidase domain-containing protein n=1 Tax=Zingiber officinale TaxID=94328 RepID=A0A8J5CDN8_ZINOF|nr:hypothetical protein ZIOFF_069454 [Zingiber officinale]